MERLTKRCCRCHKQVSRSGFHKASGRADGLQSTCKRCLQERRKDPQVAKVEREQSREYRYRAKYGITYADYVKMVRSAEGVCEICGVAPDITHPVKACRVLHVDHDHLTGKVRGVLCHECNMALGKLGDENLMNAVNYLSRKGDTWSA